jgi:integrase
MRVLLKGVHTVRKRLRSGEQAVYHYAWRGGPRLKGEPDAPEFIASYNKAHADRKAPKGRTLFNLIVEFRSSSEFTTKAPATRKDYSRYLKAIEEEFGAMPVEVLEDTEIRGDFMQWRDTMAATPRKADLAWTVLARVLSVAKDRGRIKTNPCERGGRLYEADRVDRIWTEEMIGQAIAGLPKHLHWVLMLALWTGQRQGDLLRLPWSAYKDGKIKLRQSKTGTRLLIPVGEPLRETLARIPRACPVMLTNSHRKPWTSDGFRASWGTAIKRLGIEGVTFHDLRGSAVTRLAEAGSPEAEIAAFTGHSHNDVGDILDRHYLSRTNVLTENAVRRLEGRERERAR